MDHGKGKIEESVSLVRERFAIGRSPRQVSGLRIVGAIKYSQVEVRGHVIERVSTGQGGMSRVGGTGVHYNINFGVQRSSWIGGGVQAGLTQSSTLLDPSILPDG